MKTPAFPRRKSDFPIGFFILFAFTYAGMSIYSSYFNLYLTKAGYTQAQIGVVVSVSTFFILLTQMGWGMLSDRAKNKNTVLMLLFLACSALLLTFYISVEYVFVLVVATLYAVCFNGTTPLLDNTALELAEGKRWHYGQIRIGGTIGYGVAVTVAGFVLQDEYSRIFLYGAAIFALCFVLALRLPPVRGRRAEEEAEAAAGETSETGEKKEKGSIMVLLRDKGFMALMLIFMAYSIGSSFFYNFYPAYLTTQLGGNSAQVGALLLFSALTELPFFVYMTRIIERVGVFKVVLASAILTSLRWFLLFFVTTPTAGIVVNMLQGPAYAGFSYSLINYIFQKVPKHLRATGQTLNAMLGQVFSRVIFGVVGGWASDTFGVNNTMLVLFFVMAAATVAYGLCARRHLAPAAARAPEEAPPD